MKKVSKQELVDFIKSQDDAREVNMQDCNSGYECGCVMVHYAQDVLNKNDISCGYYDIIVLENDHESEIVATLEESINNIVGDKVWYTKGKMTYGEIKEIMGLQ